MITSGCVEPASLVHNDAAAHDAGAHDAGGHDADTAAAAPQADGAQPSQDPPLEQEIPSVEVQRHGGLGFCIDDGQLMSAGIMAAGPSQPATLQARVFHAWSAGSMSCSQPPSYCAELESRERTLSSAQRRELSAALEALPATGCGSANTVVCDPCLITTVSVGGREYVYDGGCNGGCLPVRRLAVLLDRLASDPPAADAADCYSPSANLQNVGRGGATGCTCDFSDGVACANGVALQCVRVKGSGWGRWSESTFACKTP